jgi:endonuclease III
MGCEKLHDTTAPIEVQKYQTLIALMLSVQTKDETTSMVMNRLKSYGLTPQNINKMSE